MSKKPLWFPFLRFAIRIDPTIPPIATEVISIPTSEGNAPYTSFAKTWINILNGIVSNATTTL